MRKVLPNVEPGFFAFCDLVAKNGRSARSEMFNQDLGRWFDVHVFPTPKGYLGIVFTDVTARKKAEVALRRANETLEARVEERTEELQDSKERLSEVLESITDAFYAVDADWRLTYVNHRTEEWWHRSREEILGAKLWDLFPHQENTLGWLNLHRAIKERVPVHWEGYSPMLMIWVEATAYPAGDGGLAVYFRDITERKKVEAALVTANQEMSAILENIDYGFFSIGQDWRFLYVNEKAARTVGRSPGELIGKDMRAEFPEYIQTEAAGYYERVMKEGRSVTFEERGVRTGRMYEQTVYPTPKGIAVFWKDITERKRVEEELKRSNDELQQFAFVASHDLREPLRMISSYLGLLEKKYDGKMLDAKATEYMHFAMDGAKRMSTMIDDLLTYSRIETQGKPVAPVDMDEVLATLIQDFKVSIQESGASIISHGLPTVMADRTQMILLLRNLVGNAIKFRSAAPPIVEISSVAYDNEFVFSVKDNGIGIDPKYAEKLFQMFQRLHTRDEYEGTGIGLAISKKIVERHGGKIWFESEPGEGTTFYFTVRR